MKLQEFQGSPNRVERDVPRVTLNDRGVMRLNKLAWEALGSPSAVKLFFDENELVIALKPDDLRRRNAFPLTPKDRGRNRIIHTRPFCKHHKIRIERTVLFHDVEIDNEGTMLLWLDKTTAVGRGWAMR